MEMLVYPKAKVLVTLRKNRKEHERIVREAQKGYRERAIELVADLLEDLKVGKSVPAKWAMTVPENHLDDFDRIIEQLELSTGKTVELTDAEFQAYVRNRWGWQHHFLATNSVYSTTAGTTLQSFE